MSSPSICSLCLGNDTNVRMIKQPEGETCQLCTRPFTVFRWQVNDGSKRAKKTLICHTCATSKHCCQACMLDISYLIPLDIRDTALKMAGLTHLVEQGVQSRNSEVKAIKADKLDLRDNELMTNDKAKDILGKLSTRLNPKSGTKALTTNTNTNKNTKTKSSTTNLDPLTQIPKTIKNLPFGGNLKPNDKSTSFFVFGIAHEMPQYALSDYAKQFGKVKEVSIVHKAKCGFITFTSPKAAKSFAQSIIDNPLNEDDTKPGLLILEKRFPVRVSWSEVKSLGMAHEYHGIGLVANKVMELLAQKVGSGTSSGSGKGGSSGKGIRSSTSTSTSSRPAPAQPKKNSYRAAQADFEL